MCESSAFICKSNNELEKVMELGEQKIIDGIIKEIRLMDNKIIIQEN